MSVNITMVQSNCGGKIKRRNVNDNRKCSDYKSEQKGNELAIQELKSGVLSNAILEV